MKVKNYMMNGLVVKLTLGCDCGLSDFVWSSSEKLTNKKYLINQLVPVCGLVCGMGMKATIELLELLNIGQLSREHFRTVFHSFHEVVKKECNQILETAINYCNNNNASSIVQFKSTNSTRDLNVGMDLHLMQQPLPSKLIQKELLEFNMHISLTMEKQTKVHWQSTAHPNFFRTQ
jgi:aminopeptidase-like protein